MQLILSIGIVSYHRISQKWKLRKVLYKHMYKKNVSYLAPSCLL
nr:cytochrome b6/f complex subunit VI [Schisandra propinqua subsp. sinensis]